MGSNTTTSHSMHTGMSINSNLPGRHNPNPGHGNAHAYAASSPSQPMLSDRDKHIKLEVGKRVVDLRNNKFGTFASSQLVKTSFKQEERTNLNYLTGQDLSSISKTPRFQSSQMPSEPSK